MPASIGIDVPFAFSDTGGIQKADVLNKIKNNLETALRTRVGTRFMEPKYGSNFLDSVAQQSDLAFDIQVKTEVINTAKRWVPEISIVDVRTTKEDKKAFVYIKYYIKTFEITQEMLMEV